MDSAITADTLVDIPEEEWITLREKFGKEFPYGVTASSSLFSSSLNKSKIANFPVSVCSPFGNCDYGIVVIWHLTPRSSEVGLYSLGTDHSKLVEAIVKSGRLAWSHHVLFGAVMHNLVQAVYSIFNSLGIDYHADHTYIAYISKEKALAFDTEIPYDIRVEPSQQEHCEVMNQLYPHRHPGSLEYFKQMVSWGTGLAVMGQAGDLRAWVLSGIRGDIHAIQVLEGQKRKGYAQLLIRTLAKRHAEKDGEVFGCVATENEASKKMFLKMGFEFLDVVSWIETR